MEQWKERLLEEFEKLIKFLDANREHEDYYLLCKQLSVMIEYRDCLLERIHKYCGE